MSKLINLELLSETVTIIKQKLSGKVDKITGKGLSTNDFTTSSKDKLDGIEEGAQKNTVTGVKGSAESSYRTGKINLTPANIGAAGINHSHDADAALSLSSVNPVQNKVVTAQLIALDTKVDSISGIDYSVDTELSTQSTNPVENRVVTERLNEVFTSVSNGKSLLASAITDKGVDTAADATFTVMAENIALINSGNSDDIGLIKSYELAEQEEQLVEYQPISPVIIEEYEAISEPIVTGFSSVTPVIVGYDTTSDEEIINKTLLNSTFAAYARVAE